MVWEEDHLMIIDIRTRLPTVDGTIDIGKLKQNSRQLRSGLIAPATEDVSYEVAAEHTSEPIKSLDDINRITQYLIDSERWRDNMLFIVGINFGLRVSDLVALRFSHLINPNFTFKDKFPIVEKKTKNTRKVKKNRYLTINNAVIEAVTLYLEHTPGVKLSDYMFRSESTGGNYSENNQSDKENKPLNRCSVDRILKGIASDLNLNCKVSTHTLRKAFAYHQMVMSGNSSRKLLVLQKMFGHSSAAQTLDYIGITSEEIDEAYRALNLGSLTCNYLADSTIVETDAC